MSPLYSASDAEEKVELGNVKILKATITKSGIILRLVGEDKDEKPVEFYATLWPATSL